VSPNEVTFAKAEAWDDIFQTRPGQQQFLKDPVWWSQQPGLDLPDSLISAIEPEAHARIRHLFLPAFTTGALRAQEQIIQRYVNFLIERLRERISESSDWNGNGAKVDIVPWFNFTTFDIFGDLGFGESFDCLQHSRYHPWIALLFNSVKAASFVIAARFYPILSFILTKAIPPSLKKMASDHQQQIADKVQRRLNWELERPDIMSHVIQQGGVKGMAIGEINANFGFMTTAGSETTATTLCGTLNYLVGNKDKLDVLAGEIRTTFESPDQITLDAVRNLPYLNAVIKEGLRLCPPIPWVLPRRVPNGGDTVCGTWLPGGVSDPPLPI
jgi:cytochrome P450